MRNEIHDPMSEVCDCPMCERALYEILAEVMTARVRRHERTKVAKFLAGLFLALCVAGVVVYEILLTPR